jgi:hypothetical protein
MSRARKIVSNKIGARINKSDFKDLTHSSWIRFLDATASKLVNAGKRVVTRLPGITQILEMASYGAA